METKRSKVVQSPAPSEDTASFIRNLPQIVPQSWCRDCQICCRFPATEDVQTPTWSAQEVQWAKKAGGLEDWFAPGKESPSQVPVLQSYEKGCHCPAFQVEKNICSIYSDRPLDCRLYPFVLVRDSGRTRVTLAMDLKCPYLEKHGTDREVSDYSQRLSRYLESPAGDRYLSENPEIVGRSWPEFITVAPLPSMTTAVQGPAQPPHPALQPVTLKDWAALEEAFARWPHRHSRYTLAGTLGWMDLIHFWWASLEGAFCLFAEQAGGLFMPIPPFGNKGTGPGDRPGLEDPGGGQRLLFRLPDRGD